jgi:gamma-glutamylcyclotransferase (GGCT)/AIG2-like uncharacterized protein YtfP
MNIFVYGTLLKGLKRESALMKSKYSGPAGFRLVFNKKAQKAQAAYANIAFSGDNVKCPAVVYRLTSHQLNLYLARP